MKKYPDAEIIQMTKDAPQPVREVIEDMQTAFTVADLGQKHGLHIDQIGTLAELNRNMILGLVGPEEFLKDLIEAGVSDKDAREMIAEINLKIFVPLREKMRNGPPASPTVAKPTIESQMPAPSGIPATPSIPKLIVPQVPSTPVNPIGTLSASAPKGSVQSYAPPVTGLPKGSISPPLQSPKYFHEEDILPPLQVIKTGLNTGRPISAPVLKPVPTAKPIPPVLQVQTVQNVKPVDKEKLLGDHEEPHIEFKVSTPLAFTRTALPPRSPSPATPAARLTSGPASAVSDSPLRQALRTVMPAASLTGVVNKPPPIPPVPPPPPATESLITATPLQTPSIPSVPGVPVPSPALPGPLMPLNPSNLVQAEHTSRQNASGAVLPVPPKPIAPGARFTPAAPKSEISAAPGFAEERVSIAPPPPPKPSAPVSALRLAVQSPVPHTFEEAPSPTSPTSTPQKTSPTSEALGAVSGAAPAAKAYSSDPYREPIDEK
jgi:hypothetical protein